MISYNFRHITEINLQFEFFLKSALLFYIIFLNQELIKKEFKRNSRNTVNICWIDLMTLILLFLPPAPPTPQFNDIWHIVYPSDAMVA